MIMITKVKLKNWRSHLESEFNFSTGTNALIGIMGSGKTATMNGICFGLFGTFPELQSKKLKLDDMIMKKPTEKDKAEIEINFQLNDSNYSVIRVIEKGKGTTYSEIRENGRLLDSPNSQRVTETIEKILKVNYELFSKAIYSEQNALDYFLTIPKGQRMKRIDELLMIDKFEKARSNATTLSNKMAERKLAKQSAVDMANVDSLEKNISFLKESLSQMLAEKDNLIKNFGNISSEKVRIEKEVSQLKDIKDSFELLKREESGMNAAIEEAKNSLMNLERSLKDKTKEDVEKNLFDSKRNLENLEKISREKQHAYENIAVQLSKSKAQLDFIKKEKIEILEKEIEEKLRIKKEFDQFKGIFGENVARILSQRRESHEQLIAEVQEMKVKIKDLDDIIQQISDLSDKCPICESRLTEEKKNLLVEQKRQQIKTLEEKLESANKNKELNEHDVKRLEDAVRKLDQMLVEIRDFDLKRTDLENSKKIFSELNELAIKDSSQLLQMKEEIESISKQLKDSLERKQSFEIIVIQQKEYEKNFNRFNDLMKQKIHFEDKIKIVEAKIFDKNLDELESRLKQLIANEKEVETKINNFDQLLNERQSRISEYEKVLEKVLKEKTEVEKLDKLIKEMRIFGKALEQTQIELRTEFIEAVNYSMNKLWHTLYPYYDFSSVKLSVEEGDYVLQLQEKSGRWINVEGVASGGERSIACLTLRIAFALVLAPHLQILVLDEPTANLDRAAIRVMAETLRERINEFISQVFIITHQEELEDAVTGSAYRLERDKSRDDVTKVVDLM